MVGVLVVGVLVVGVLVVGGLGVDRGVRVVGGVAAMSPDLLPFDLEVCAVPPVEPPPT